MSTASANASRSNTTGAHGQTDFDAVADAYDESLPEHVVEHYIDKRVTFIRQHVALGRVLDVGCGTGVLAVVRRVINRAVVPGFPGSAGPTAGGEFSFQRPVAEAERFDRSATLCLGDHF